MGTRQATKTKLKKIPIEFTLISTRLVKIAVETSPPSEKLIKGKLELSYKAGLNLSDDGNSVLLSLEISGKGIPNEKSDKTNAAFVFEAAIDGEYNLSRKPDKDELDGREMQLANYLTPLLSDMVESILIKCGYKGVSLAKSVALESHENLPN